MAAGVVGKLHRHILLKLVLLAVRLMHKTSLHLSWRSAAAQPTFTVLQIRHLNAVQLQRTL